MAVHDQMDGSFVLAEEVTESAFKQGATDASILHLAMHAYIDDEKPMNSKLVFHQGVDDPEDGFLHIFELCRMNSHADLAVLSACETGYGKLVKGEGIMSLATGFSYAGVPSVVMSHWQVDDQSTSELMKLFYGYLAEGLPKSVALRKAKSDYLQVAAVNKKHPFYWAAFVVIADDSLIVTSGRWTVYLIGGLLAMVIIIIGVYRWRKKSL
ncbi:MAG: CHAT domain-containing protein [Bacteroidota bacterium]